jgi:ABC-type dipeptide/oligopeptide/nickel transport system permease component
MVPLLFVISIVAFMVMHLAPGDPTVFFVDPTKAGGSSRGNRAASAVQR